MKTYAVYSLYAPYKVQSFIQVFPAPSYETILIDCVNGQVKPITRANAVRALRGQRATASRLVSTVKL